MILESTFQQAHVRSGPQFDPSYRMVTLNKQNIRSPGLQASNAPQSMADIHRRFPPSSDPFSDPPLPTSINPDSTLRDMWTQPEWGGATTFSAGNQPSGYIAPTFAHSGPAFNSPTPRMQHQRTPSNGQTSQMHQSNLPPPAAPLNAKIGPASPTALSTLHFKSREAVRDYLQRPTSHTVSGLWAVPETEEESAFYVRKLADALLNIDDVWDAEDFPWSLLKFQPGSGECTDPIYVESMAWVIVIHAAKIHRDGVTGPHFTFASHFKSQASMDEQCSFPQRIEFLARLFRHSKMAASEVMSRQYVDKYVALPFTHLRQFHQFKNYWDGMTQEQRKYQLATVSYPPFVRQYNEQEARRMFADFQRKQSLRKPHDAEASSSGGARRGLGSEVSGFSSTIPVGGQGSGGLSAQAGPSTPETFTTLASLWGPEADSLVLASELRESPLMQNNLFADVAQPFTFRAGEQGHMEGYLPANNDHSFDVAVGLHPCNADTNPQPVPSEVDAVGQEETMGGIRNIDGAEDE